jgi:hypothetical protein
MLLLDDMFDLPIRQGGPREPEGRLKGAPQASGRYGMSDMGLERPVADSVEQSQDAVTDGTELHEYNLPREVPLEADEADAAEQERALGHDEDDYR